MVSPIDSNSYVVPKNEIGKQKVTILDARYYKDECWLVVNVLTVAGKKRSCTIPTLNRFKGNIIGEAESHRQMEILAKMFNENRGRHIMMVIADVDTEHQMPYEDAI